MPNPVFFFRHKRPALALCGMPSLLTSCYNNKFFTSDQISIRSFLTSYYNVTVPDLVFPFRYEGPAPALSGIISFLTSYYNVKLLNSAYYFKVQLSLNVPDPCFFLGTMNGFQP